jgi:serine/threonine protein kinase
MLVEGQELTLRYRIKRQLNKGGMGAVYEAYDNVLDSRVAIKESLYEEENLRAAFRREAQLLANLNHPSLPHCSDFFAVGKAQYLVMEFIDGDDAATIMSNRQNPLPAETVINWAKQMFDVLEYVHSQAILHRDITPANVKVRNGHLYLLDFGLAYGQSGEMNTIANGAFNWNCHTPRYSPLEQLRGERTSQASDLYSLAATLYKLITNAPPDDAESRFQSSLRGEKDKVESTLRGQNVDAAVRRTIVRALSLNMNERPQSATDMRQMMFPEKARTTEPKPPRRIVTARLLAWVFGFGMLAGVFLLVSKNLFQDQILATSTPAPGCVDQVGNLTSNLSLGEQSATLTDEAVRLHQSGKDEEAIRRIRQGIALDSNNAYAHSIYLDLLWDTKAETVEFAAEITEVQEQADIIFSLLPSPRSAKEYAALALANLAKGRLPEAIANANAALKRNQELVQALMIRASARYADTKGKIDKTFFDMILADYNSAIALAPNYTQAYANRADIHLRLGDLELARSDYQKANTLTTRASFYSKLGNVDFLMRDFVAARDNFQKAIDTNETYYQAYIGLGDIFFHDQDWRNAERNYLSANRLNKTAAVFRKLGDTYHHLDQSDASRRNYEVAHRLGLGR